MHAATDISTLRRADVFFAKHLCACSARRKFCGVVVVPILAPYYVEAIGPLLLNTGYASIGQNWILADTGYASIGQNVVPTQYYRYHRDHCTAPIAGVVVHPERKISFAVPRPFTQKGIEGRSIPLGTIRPSKASPLVIKQRLSRSRSLSHRPLTNSPLGNFRQIRSVSLADSQNQGLAVY